MPPFSTDLSHLDDDDDDVWEVVVHDPSGRIEATIQGFLELHPHLEDEAHVLRPIEIWSSDLLAVARHDVDPARRFDAIARMHAMMAMVIDVLDRDTGQDPVLEIEPWLDEHLLFLDRGHGRGLLPVRSFDGFDLVEAVSVEGLTTILRSLKGMGHRPEQHWFECPPDGRIFAMLVDGAVVGAFFVQPLCDLSDGLPEAALPRDDDDEAGPPSIGSHEDRLHVTDFLLDPARLEAKGLLLVSLADGRYRPNAIAHVIGHVLDVFGAWHRIDALPDDLVVEGDLRLGDAPIPPRMKLQGRLGILGREHVVIPSDVRASQITVLGARSVRFENGDGSAATHAFHGALMFCEVADLQLPPSVLVCTGLMIMDCGQVRYPETIRGDLIVALTPVTGLRTVSGDVRILGSTTRTLPDDLDVWGDVDLNDSKGTGDGLRVGGTLTIGRERRQAPLRIGSGLKVEGALVAELAHGKLALPSGTRVGVRVIVEAASIEIGADCVLGGLLLGDHCRKLRVGTGIVVLDELVNDTLELIRDAGVTDRVSGLRSPLDVKAEARDRPRDDTSRTPDSGRGPGTLH